MPEFLQLSLPGDALALFLSHLPPREPPSEDIAIDAALGQVLAAAVIAPEALPAFDRSTVDGFAVMAADTFGAGESLPAYLAVRGEIAMGQRAAFDIQQGEAALIHTGGMLPKSADAVVMVENTQGARPGEIEVLRAVAVGDHILRAGEDVSQGAQVMEAGVLLRAAEIGGLAALGITRVAVARKPRIAILSSGDEIVAPEEALQPGQVRDVNRFTLSALIEKSGGAAVFYGIIRDERTILERALRQALVECDAVVVTAGSSASVRDYTADAIRAMGAPGVLVHGINIKPGKPTILGVCDGKAVIGLPGNPVSALVVGRIFVRALVEALLGLQSSPWQPSVTASLTLNLDSQAGREDWVPVRLVKTAKGWAADPIFYKSNLIFSLIRADGLVHIPAAANGLAAGEQVEVEIL